MIPARKGHAHFQVDKTGHEILQDFLPLKSLIPSGSFGRRLTIIHATIS